jgi:hypothetical protein
VISSIARILLVAFLAALASSADAQQRRLLAAPFESVRNSPQDQRTAAVAAPVVQSVAPAPPLKSLLVGVPLADVGQPNGFRLSNLGGRREIYIPVPQGIELNVAQLILAYDDVSAHEARRSLEILVNDRSVFALALDGKGTPHTVRIPLANAAVRDGFLKLSFLYSGAATQDRCIDVRYVGDSITVRPESAVEFEISITGTPNITATAALMPKDVAILLSNLTPPPADIAAALTLARSLAATGRQVTFYHGAATMPSLVERGDKRRWSRGLIVVGAFSQIEAYLDAPVATMVSAVGSVTVDNTLAAARIAGVPVLLVTDPASALAGSLSANSSLSVLRDTPSASVGQVFTSKHPTDRISFDALGLVPAQAEVFGRADLAVTIPSSTLPGGTRPTRLVLDLMVAPDGSGEKAVVSAFVNERLLASTVAAIGEPTRLDFALPDGLVGSVANIRMVIQRRNSQGDCRFEPQGYPAEILGSSSVILSLAGFVAHDFSDLATLWANGVEVMVPSSTAAHPLSVVVALADVLSALSTESAPIAVKYISDGTAPAPSAPFIAISNVPPIGAEQRVRFDHGRVAVTDRANNTLLDVGGLTTGAVVQVVTSNDHPGLWIKPLSGDGSLPAPPAVNLDRGDVAFLDKTGIALALSTERDTLMRISYVEQVSVLTSLDRFRSWIVGGVWVLITFALLFVSRRIYRRRQAIAGK